MLELLYSSGLRVSELVGLKISDLRRDPPVLLVQGKGRTSKDERVPLDAPALDPLDAYLRDRPATPTAPLFVSHGHRSEGTRLNTRSVRGRVNGHLRTAKVKRRGVSPHSLTHTAALIWLNSGMPVEEVRRRMRHGTLETTMISFKKQGLLTRDPEQGDPE